MVSLSGQQVLRMRMAAQGLGARGAGDVAAAVTGCAGIQAQDLLSSRLAVRARMRHMTEAQVARACDQERSVVRTWLMRGTLHMVAAADVRWLVRLLGPTIAARFQRRRAQLGLDPALCERLLQKLPGVLAGRSLSRREVVADLAQAGVRFDPAGQAAAHAMVFAAAAGVICRGPDREVEGEPTYVLLKEWLARVKERRPLEPEVELARRYFAGFGPAAVEDFAAWSGFGLPAARAACSPLGLVTVDCDGRRLLLAGVGEEGAGWRLLPKFDTYLVGYRDRTLLRDAATSQAVYAGGWIHPAVVHDGRLVGSWRLRRQYGASAVTIRVQLSFGVPGDEEALEAEASDVGRFLGIETRLELRRG
ncbi:MAG: winged helix DNA-binding domain-containing protein [Candidatus Dormibacter sp.]|uniref:winged helix DNA-binding domain-containing protein n=1 Tax=Candidatus Dormibacter sp. TaxID=2973982 RepID=UPI000DB638BA|nr:MAG: winged helix DNA-binding domain-containing protein [Candidatus Dormibacteraeota bacterium]